MSEYGEDIGEWVPGNDDMQPVGRIRVMGAASNADDETFVLLLVDMVDKENGDPSGEKHTLVMFLDQTEWLIKDLQKAVRKCKAVTAARRS